MVIERARIDIGASNSADFEAIMPRARELFLGSRGCEAVHFERSVEQPSHYVLVVEWATIEDHLTHFRSSDVFTQWRALIADFVAGPPSVEHLSKVSF